MISTISQASQSAMLNAWDLTGFFTNSKDYVQTAGGAFIMLLGTIAVVWSAYHIVKKLWGSQPGQGKNWGEIIALLIVGGAFMVGGFSIMEKVSSGGQKTVTDLGGSFIHLDTVANVFSGFLS